MSAAAKDVLEMLRRHHNLDDVALRNRPAGGLLACEIEAPGGGRRADALWAPLTWSAGEGLIGYEVKVSRADLLSELRDPTKSEPWAQHCTQWFLVVADPALIDGLHIPERWGVLAPPSGRRSRAMTTLRPAPVHKPGDTSAAWRRVMAWEHHRAAAALSSTTAELARERRATERAEAALQAAKDEGALHGDPRAARAFSLLAAFDALRDERREREPNGPPLWAGNDQAIAEAAHDLLSARAAAAEIENAAQHTLRRLELTLEPVAHARTLLEAVRRSKA